MSGGATRIIRVGGWEIKSIRGSLSRAPRTCRLDKAMRELEVTKASLLEAQSDANSKDVALAKARKDVELAKLLGSSSSAEKERILEEEKVRLSARDE